MAIERRILRTGCHRARIEHRCDSCDNLIFPTDLYNVTVEVRRAGKATWLFVRKEHEHPNCPYPDGDEDSSFEALIPYVLLKLAA